LLADTFQMYEEDRDMISNLMMENSKRRTHQKQLDIRVIMGNPPYSVGQKNANDNAANVRYENLDEKIRGTYVKHSNATGKRALYDSYVRAIRWASDRVGEAGVMAYVSNAGWIDSASTSGLRKCLVDEFSNLYVFNLRGNALTQGEQRRKEKGNIFGENTKTPIAISVFVKNPNSTEHGRIYYYDIGDYLSTKEKLDRIKNFGSINKMKWENIVPDERNDWLNKRDTSLEKFPVIGNKRGEEKGLFSNYSRGIMTCRDAWCYNASKHKVEENMKRMIGVYNSEVDRYQNSDKSIKVEDFIEKDLTKIKWDGTLNKNLIRGKKCPYDQASMRKSLYRPFTVNWMYFDKDYSGAIGQLPSILPPPDILM